jgi:UDP-N-acetylglucosamine--N-acetylmuramyl-(pentapeptide) pyrophosphoryl-undecaprenol N-acetylglucosamine transferase
VSAPIVIAAGGTGGHFFPAEALAAELTSRGRTVALMTDARSSGETSTVFAGSERFVLRGAGIAGRGVVKAGRAAVALAAGTIQARKILQRLRPSAIVGFGGYPSVAPVLASRMLSDRPRVVLHEQNAVLGRANRMLAPMSDVLALSFAETTKVPAKVRTSFSGNPVRTAIMAMAGRGYTPRSDVFQLLVLGGSQGARVFSSVVPDAIRRLPEGLVGRLRITQQCRAEDIDQVRAAYSAIGVSAELASFFPNVAELLEQAHLVIARAGASTVAELAAVGRPSILVPLPSAIDDHQRANAKALADAGGAWMMHQSIFFGADLADFLQPLMEDPAYLAPLAAAAAGFGSVRAAQVLADLVEQTITSQEIAA